MLDIEEFVITPSAEKRWLSTSKVPMRNAGGEIIGIVGISRDVTDRKLRRGANTCTWRIMIADWLGQPVCAHGTIEINAIVKAQREATSVSVVFLDLDRFKAINDSFGHNAGDTLLRVLAVRMLRCVRETDTVARLSGDEFVVLLEEERIGDQSRALSIVERLQVMAAEPVSIAGHQVSVSCSIGVTSCPQDGTDPDALLTNADLAMYRAKQRGRDTYNFHSRVQRKTTRNTVPTPKDGRQRRR